MSAGSLTEARRPVFWVIFAAAMVLPALVWMWQPHHARRHGSSAGVLPDYGTLPNFSLVERSGREIQAQDLAGAPWFADFIYTTCEGVCPKLSAEMAKLARRIGTPSRVKLVSFSVDPLKDTPEALREYATRFQASPDDWLFLTGEVHALRKLIRNGFHLAVVDPPADEPKFAGIITHSEKIVLVDASGRIRRYYDGGEDGWIDQALGDLTRLAANPAETRS
jgi:cytochrome oxidase Cu insertion factor (SCO1/SenC/PrrC family)